MATVRSKHDRERIESIFQATRSSNSNVDNAKTKKTHFSNRDILPNQMSIPKSPTIESKWIVEDFCYNPSVQSAIVPTSPLQLITPDGTSSDTHPNFFLPSRGDCVKLPLTRQSSHPQSHVSGDKAKTVVTRQSSVHLGGSVVKEGLRKKVNPSSGSCPNLHAQLSPNFRPRNPTDRMTREERRSRSAMSEIVSVQSLNVPDVFTTSFTYNMKAGPTSSRISPTASARVDKTRPGTQRQSSERVSLTTEDGRWSNTSMVSLTNVEMDYDLQMNDIIPTIQRCPTTEGLYHRDAYMSQIVDFLYIGSVQAAYNAYILCKLDIQSVVDLTNMTTAEEHIFKTRTVPCLCPLQGNHARSRLRLTINDRSEEDFSLYFPDINKFIEGNRKKQKTILIYSYHGSSRAPTAVIQYLMQYQGMSLNAAYGLMKSRRSNLRINRGFQRLLESLEKQLNPNKTASLAFRSDSFNDSKGRVNAWTQ